MEAEADAESESDEEADTVEELNADGESVAKKQKTKDGAANRFVAPELKIKQYFRQFGDVGYVELAEKHCSVRFKVPCNAALSVSRVVRSPQRTRTHGTRHTHTRHTAHAHTTHAHA